MKTSVDALNWTCDIKVQLQDIFFLFRALVKFSV